MDGLEHDFDSWQTFFKSFSKQISEVIGVFLKINFVYILNDYINDRSVINERIKNLTESQSFHSLEHDYNSGIFL